ncbi:MAG TPA: hypothetical protein PKX87_09205, partial [Alphaproteobacteria bacterium]|nr:hypothetical protein [Alphaproteobacteria bacterium]
GPYCLELHSTKAKKTEILKSIEERLKRRSPRQNADLAAKIREFKKHRDHVTEYIDILNAKFGRGNRTVHDCLWSAQLRKERTASLPNSVRQIRIPYDQANMTDGELSAHLDDLRLIVELKKETDKDKKDGVHPWDFISNFDLNPFQQDELKDVLREWKGTIEELADRAEQFSRKQGVALKDGMTGVNAFLKETETLARWDIKEVDEKLLGKIATVPVAKGFLQFSDDAREYREARERITAIRDIDAHINEIAEIEAAIFASQCLRAQNLTAAEIKKEIGALQEELKLWERNLKALFEIGRAFGFSKDDDLQKTADLAAMPEYIASIPREYLLHRTKEVLEETNAERLKSAHDTQGKVRESLKTMEEQYDFSLLGAPHEIRTDAAIIEGAGFFSIFDPAYRK